MKIEKLYENLNTYVSTLEESDAATVKKLAADPAAPALGDSLTLLASILREVRAEIATAKAKSTGRRGILGAARRLLKVAETMTRKDFFGAWTGKDGRQYICSGFHGAALNEPLDLPESAGGEMVEVEILGSRRSETQPLSLPTASQVRSHIKICKAEKDFFCGRKGHIVWDFGPGLPLVNAQYLLDMLELLPDACAMCHTQNTEISPIYFTCAAGDGVLLPARPPENYTRENTANRYAPAPEEIHQEEPAKLNPQETPADLTQNLQEDKPMKTGDIVQISNAYSKSYNGLYFVEHSPGDPGWLGTDYSLHRITKAGKLSTSKYNTHFWPLRTFSNNREYTAKADAWNAEHAQIAPATVKDLSQIAAHFQQKAEGAKKYADHYAWDWGEDHPEVQRGRACQALYESVVHRLCPEGIEIPSVPEENPTESPEEIARQIAEREAAEKRRAEVERQIQEGRAYIEKISQQHPIRPGEPVVKIRWSEHPAFYSWEDDALDLSPAAAEIILGHYDLERAEDGAPGYDKTKFLITWTDEAGETNSYEGRYDLGDNDGGLIAHIRDFAACRRKHPYNSTLEEAEEEAKGIEALADRLAACTATVAGDVVSFTWAPWLEAAAQQKRKSIQDLHDMVDLLTDEQLEEAIRTVDPKDSEKENVAKYFLQILFQRNPKRALEFFRRWRSGEA